MPSCEKAWPRKAKSIIVCHAHAAGRDVLVKHPSQLSDYLHVTHVGKPLCFGSICEKVKCNTFSHGSRI